MSPTRTLLPTVLLLAAVTALGASESAARLLPGRPLLVIEAADLSASLAGLRDSPQMAAWYARAGYADFKNTKLAQKLSSRMAELEGFLGAGVNTKNLGTIAGRESALGLYEIGKLQAVYATRMDASAFAASALAPLCEKFDRRQGAGKTWFAKLADDGSLEFAFTQSGDWLLASTSVALLEAALVLPISGPLGDCAAADPRFVRAGSLEPGPADLRVFLDQGRLSRDTYFRSYWIHRNVSELSWIDAGLLSARFLDDAIEERRVFLPAAGAAPPATSSVDAGTLIAPPTTAHAIYWHVTAHPGPGEIARTLCQELLGVPQDGDSRQSGDVSERLAAAFAPCRFQAMTRVVGDAAERDGYYLDVPAAVVLEGSAGAQAVQTGWQEPVRRWLSSELTGQPDHPSIVFVSKGAVTGLEVPFSAGRGFYEAQTRDRVVFSSRASLAEALAAAETGERPAPGPVWELRFLDLSAGRGVFGKLVSRAIGKNDPLQTFFGEDWGGLLQSFSSFSRIVERSWVEGDTLRQLVRYERGAGR